MVRIEIYRLAAILVVGAPTLAACEGDAAEELETEALTGEAAQAAAPGQVVAEMKRGADPGVTIYQPAPDLSRPEAGVVYVPGAPPSPAPGDTAIGTEGPTAQAVRAAGAIPPEDTLRRAPGAQDSLRIGPRPRMDTIPREE